MESTEHKLSKSVLNHSLLYCNSKSQHFRWGNSKTSSVTSAGVQCCCVVEWMKQHCTCILHAQQLLHTGVFFRLTCFALALMLHILMHKGKRSQFLYCSYMSYRAKRYETVSDVTTTNYRGGWTPPGCASLKCQKSVCVCVCASCAPHFHTM